MYASGYIKGNAKPNVNDISEFVGIRISEGSGFSQFSQKFSITGLPHPVYFGPKHGVKPWFHVTDSTAKAIGWYNANGFVSVASKHLEDNTTVIYSATPYVPEEMFRYIAGRAGVHFFSKLCDIVEAKGNMFFVIAGSNGKMKVSLPKTARHLYKSQGDANLSLLCSNCQAFDCGYLNKNTIKLFTFTP